MACRNEGRQAGRELNGAGANMRELLKAPFIIRLKFALRVLGGDNAGIHDEIIYMVLETASDNCY